MKILLVKPESLPTNFDNKKTEIKKYMDNLDFEQNESKNINLLKRVALLLLNEEEIGQITIDYNNGKIDYKNNLEYLLAAKILKKEEILVKVISNEEQFIQEYQAKDTNIQVNNRNVGFINWEEKNKINQNDWTDINFLKERIELSSLENVLQELRKKDNNMIVSPEFIEFMKSEYKHNPDNQSIYFSQLTNEELKSNVIINALKDSNYEDVPHFFPAYLNVCTNEQNKKDKDLVNIIKFQVINEKNIVNIFNKQNIQGLSAYIPPALRSHDHIVDCVTTNMMSGTRYKLNLDEAIKIIGKKYLTNKKNFVLFVNSIGETPMRTNDSTDKILKYIIYSFDLNNEQDKKCVNYLIDQSKMYNEYWFLSKVLNLIINNNKDKINDKDKIKLFAKGILQLDAKEALEITKDESDISILLSTTNRKTTEVLQSKLKEITNLEDFFTQKENIIKFLKISFDDNWLKNKIIPQSWKENNEILIETYGKKNYNDLSLSKRKQLEESRENVLKLLELNKENFNVIRSEIKYDPVILEDIANDKPSDFAKILSQIPAKKWFNFNFALKLLDYHPESLKFIPTALFDNKQFTLSVFEKYESNHAYSMKNLLVKIPEELKSFLQENNITNEYVSMLNKHFLKDVLEVTLVEKNDKTKKLKI